MLTNARLVYQSHDHDRGINAAIAQAHELCANLNKRLTPTREIILKLLWQSHQPLGAYQLQDLLSEVTGKKVAPPTVYRAIEFLLELRLIHRIASLNAFIGCPFPTFPVEEHSNIFMICAHCNNVVEVADRQVNQLLESISNRVSFKLDRQSVELFGLCPNCDTGHTSRITQGDIDG